jgi:hypothetical protein
MRSGEYYWCLKHNRVESGDKVCAVRNRIGPFATVAEAEHALEKVQERNEVWETENARWEGKRR